MFMSTTSARLVMKKSGCQLGIWSWSKLNGQSIASAWRGQWSARDTFTQQTNILIRKMTTAVCRATAAKNFVADLSKVKDSLVIFVIMSYLKSFVSNYRIGLTAERETQHVDGTRDDEIQIARWRIDRLAAMSKSTFLLSTFFTSNKTIENLIKQTIEKYKLIFFRWFLIIRLLEGENQGQILLSVHSKNDKQ